MMNVYEALLCKGFIPDGEVDMAPRCPRDILFRQGFIPQVHAAGAVANAKSMLKGHCSVMEIAFEKGAVEAIRAVSQQVPEMLVGAGEIRTAEQCRQAIDAGAKFISCTAADAESAALCREENVAMILTCTDIEQLRQANAIGVSLVNYDWQVGEDNLQRLQELAAAAQLDMKFIVTLGENTGNIGECTAAPFVLGVRGTWLQDACACKSHSEDRIITVCEDLLTEVLGYMVHHIGINTEGADAARALCDELHDVFRMKLMDNGISSRFAGPGIEVMKRMYLGDNGHFAIRTNNADRAILWLKEMGYEMDWETKFPGHGPINTIYIKDHSFGGFAVHLKQRPFPGL